MQAVDRACTWFDARGWDLALATPVQMATYRDTLPKSFATISQFKVAVGHYWESEGRPSPPLRAIRVPPRPEMVCRALDEDDARILAKHARSRGDLPGLAVVIGLYSALRRAEIAALRWADMDAGMLTVVGKGEKKAAIPLHPLIVESLAAFPHERPFVFPGRFGGCVTPATVWSWTRLVAEDAGVPFRVQTHQLRHTALATANDATGDLRSVQAFARHSRIQTTSGYTRASGRRLKAVVESLDY